MKIPKIKIFIVFFIFFISSRQYAQWNRTSLNTDITCSVINGNNIFLGTNGSGILISTNNGSSWEATNQGLTNKLVYSITTNGTDIFAGTNDGVFVSSDNGTHWTSAGLTNMSVKSLVLNGSTLLAGTWGGFFMSTDNGHNWVQHDNGLTNTYVNCLLYFGTDLLIGTDGGGIFRSTDDGSTWNGANTGIPGISNALSFAVINNNVFVTVPYNSGVYVSANNGTNWNAVNTVANQTFITSIATSGTNLYVGTDNAGTFLSTDNGNNWSAFGSGLPADSIITYLFVEGNSLFANTINGSVYSFTLNNIGWAQVLNNTSVNSIATIGNNIFAGVVGGGIFRSTDNGETWSSTLQSNIGTDRITENGTDVFVEGSGGIALSIDNGNTWNKINSGLPIYNNSGEVTCLAINSMNLYAGVEDSIGTLGSVYYSSNYGKTWSSTNLSNSGLIMGVLSVNNNIFAGFYGEGVFRSTDNGITWGTVNNGITVPYIYVLANSGATIFAGGPGVYRSTDMGDSWSAENNILPNDNLGKYTVRDFVFYKNNIFVGTSAGVFLSTNNGDTWLDVNEGLINKNVWSLAINQNYLFVATEAGIKRRAINEMVTGVQSKEINLPTIFSLSQNYPNPFNPTTTIIYTIPKSSLVTIKVYDILGKLVETLVNAQKIVGNYKVEFNASKFASGVYFYQLRAGNFISTKKLVLLK